MNHSVNSVQTLHDDAFGLFTNVVIGSAGTSADNIISNLSAGIDNLKANWKGKDAGVQIQNVITVHNGMVDIRETLAELARLTSQIAAEYRNIQNSNGAALEPFTVINYVSKGTIGEYSDITDTISITDEALQGQAKINAAKDAMDGFIQDAKKYYNNIMQNWTAGTQRDDMITRFTNFINKSTGFKETLGAVANSIVTALENYKKF